MSLAELRLAVDVHGILDRLSSIGPQAYYRINHSSADQIAALQSSIAADLAVFLQERGFVVSGP